MPKLYGGLQKQLGDGLIDGLTGLRLEIRESRRRIDFKTIPLIIRRSAEIDSGHRKTHCLTQLKTSVRAF